MSGLGTKKAIIFDLDGTLASDAHRNHHLWPVEKRNWDAYFEACDKDAPRKEIIAIAQAFSVAGHPIHILTGRAESTLDKTVRWLCDHGVPFDSLRMRPMHDRTDDHILKPIWGSQLGGPSNILFIVEDRQRVVDAWRLLGYTVLQCAKGNF